MPVEIDENEVTRLRGTEKLMMELLSGKTARRAHELIKEHHPEYKAPALDPEETQKEIDARVTRAMEEREKKSRDSKLEDDFQAKLNSYRLSPDNPDGYTDEGIEKIKQVMKEFTIADVEAAVLKFEQMNPRKSEPPSGYHPTGWNFGVRSDDNTKLLFEDPDAWADQEARKVWEENRKANSA